MIEQSARYRYAVIAVAQPAGEGVERAVLDDLKPWNRNAAGDAQILQQIIQPRRLRALYAGRARGVVDHLLMKEICDAEPDARRAEGQRPAFLHVEDRAREDHVERRVLAHRLEDQREGEHQRDQQHDKAGEQKGRTHPVGLNMRIKPIRPEHRRRSCRKAAPAAAALFPPLPARGEREPRAPAPIIGTSLVRTSLAAFPARPCARPLRD